MTRSSLIVRRLLITIAQRIETRTRGCWLVCANASSVLFSRQAVYTQIAKKELRSSLKRKLSNATDFIRGLWRAVAQQLLFISMLQLNFSRKNENSHFKPFQFYCSYKIFDIGNRPVITLKLKCCWGNKKWLRNLKPVTWWCDRSIRWRLTLCGRCQVDLKIKSRGDL